MKTISKISLIMVVATLGSRAVVSAQITTYLSNLAEPSSGFASIASDSWQAGRFTTGSSSAGYHLSSVQLRLSPSVGNPTGLSVSIYNDTFDGDILQRVPNISIGSLVGSNPFALGINTFTNAGIFLSPLSRYFVVVTSDTPVGQGSYNWNIAATSSYDSTEGWFLGALGYDSADGETWSVTRPRMFQFSINAIAVVPEPSSFALLGMGGSFVFTRLARKSRSKALSQQ